MSLGITIAAMTAAGCSAEQINAVVQAHLAEDEKRKVAKRAKDAERQRRSRMSRSVTVTPCDSDGQGVTPRDTPSPKERSPTPPKEITPSPSSLRSVSYRVREAFGEFWAAYPRRDGSNPKQPAEQKFVRLVDAGTDPAEITSGARRYAAAVAGEDPRFVAQAVTWLNQGRWRDDHVPPARAGPAGNRPRGPTMAEMARMDEPGFTFDDPRPDPRDSPTRTADAPDQSARGFAGRLSFADREKLGGEVVDL